MASIWIILVIFALIGGEVNCVSETFGERTENIALKENVLVKGDMLGVKTIVIDFPEKDKIKPETNTTLIRGISHVDYKQPGHGPSVRFIKGGVGQTFVSMELISKRGRGIKSAVLIYV